MESFPANEYSIAQAAHIMNRLLAKELLNSGWLAEATADGGKQRGYKYWGVSKFKK